MNLLWRIVGFLLSATAGFVAQKCVELFWEKGLKNQKPSGNESDAELPIFQLTAFAAVTAAANALVTAIIDRRLIRNYGEHSVNEDIA